jgi:16S rRNA (guanine966-N2)-methyltransferase
VRIEAGCWKGRSLPRPGGARPAGARLRKSLFSVIAARIPGARVLDLFAGAGAFGLEAASRGAGSVVLVERDAGRVRALATWLKAAGADRRVELCRRDALRAALPPGPFDLVFVDPPFALWEGKDAARLLARAVGALAPDGLALLKVPGRWGVPEDPRWAVRRRRAVGDAAWVLLAPGDEA